MNLKDTGLEATKDINKNIRTKYKLRLFHVHAEDNELWINTSLYKNG